MSINQSSLPLMFLFPILLIVVVTLISTISSVSATNNVLSQNGDSNAVQETEQFQMSDQDNQVISGDASINSGNNIQCNSQINSKTTSSVSDNICAIDDLNGPNTNEDKVKIKLIIQYIVDPGCVPGQTRDHGCNGGAGTYTITSGTSVISRGTTTIGDGQVGKTIEVSAPYNRFITVDTQVQPVLIGYNGYEVSSSHIVTKPDEFMCSERHGLVETINCTTFNATLDGQEKVFFFVFNIDGILT